MSSPLIHIRRLAMPGELRSPSRVERFITFMVPLTAWCAVGLLVFAAVQISPLSHWTSGGPGSITDLAVPSDQAEAADAIQPAALSPAEVTPR
ncbi:MAG: hypothetical protein H7840_16190 [Alphaproteobacteria bacterium]